MFNGYYMLVRQGCPQRLTLTHNGYEYTAWPVTRSHRDAMRLTEWLGDKRLRPARIGSVQDESFEQHMVVAAMDGCEVIWMITGWEPNGSPKWSALPILDFNDKPAQQQEPWFHIHPSEHPGI